MRGGGQFDDRHTAGYGAGIREHLDESRTKGCRSVSWDVFRATVSIDEGMWVCLLRRVKLFRLKK